MILSLNRYTPRLALRIRNTVDRGQTTEWEKLQLVIEPAPMRKGCHVGGSPWFLCGCWPFHPTGVDVANPCAPEFPAIIIDAEGTDLEGRVQFPLKDKIWDLPNGRYLGTVRIHSHTPPINIPVVQKAYSVFGQLGAASTYNESKNKIPCCCPHPIKLVSEPSCELFSFEIDLGPECAQHMVDQVEATVQRSTCGDDVEFTSGTCGSCYRGTRPTCGDIVEFCDEQGG